MADNRTRIWFSLFVLAVFSAGIAAGVILDRQFGPARRFGPPGRSGPPPEGRGGRGGPSPDRLIERLDRELDLSDEQVASIRAVFEKRREPLERLQREMRDRMDQEQRELRAEIKQALNAEQQAKFDKWLESEPRGLGPGRGRGGRRGPGPPPDR